MQADLTPQPPQQRGPVAPHGPHGPSTTPEGPATPERATGGRTAVRCAQHPTAPVIGGTCGACTIHPAARTTPDSRTDSPDSAQHRPDTSPGHNPLTSTDTIRTTPDNALREQYVATLRDFPIALWTPEALADRILSIRDRRMEQITNRLIYAAHVAADERGRAYNAEQRAEEAESAITRVRRLAEHWQSTVRPGEYHPATRAVFAALDGAPAEPHPAEAERDQAYAERAALLAWISALHPANAVITTAADIDEPGWQLLYLLVGGWQMSWHIHPRDAELFTHVEQVEPTDPRAQWDGHSTAEKYERIQQHVERLAADRP